MSEADRPGIAIAPSGRWKESIAALGVMLSLIFVGLELRQNTVAVRAAARNELAAGSREWMVMMAESPDLTVAMRLWLTTGSELSESQERTVLHAVRALLRNVENVYFQVRAGIVPEAALKSYGFQSEIFRGPRFHDFWMTERDTYDSEFVALFEARLGIR